jgi:hypothetical protein
MWSIELQWLPSKPPTAANDFSKSTFSLASQLFARAFRFGLDLVFFEQAAGGE